MPDTSTPVDLLRGLAVLSEPPSEEHAYIAGLIGLPSSPTPAEYSDVFLFQLYPYASVHLGSEGMLGGEARARIAGFWTALGQRPPAEPDHLAALLGLLATLADTESSVVGPEAALTRQARTALMNEHLAPWIFAYLDRIGELAAGPYQAWATILGDVLRGELTRAGRPEQLVVHLREALPLPDPRAEGADAFLAGLLAPVRSGVLLTRADLGRVARDLDLGLRAGERRYALEHLLAQASEPVLRSLSAEASRQGECHRARSAWLGASADFLADRAHRAATLLRDLADEQVELGGVG